MIQLFAAMMCFGFSMASFAQEELFKPTHGGQEVKKSGLSYEVVRKSREVLVYPPKADAPVPSVIKLKFKNKDGIIDQVQLKLLPMKEPGMNIYSAPVPASVYIAGGVTFDLDFKKKTK
jgi:hypothetical protein